MSDAYKNKDAGRRFDSGISLFAHGVGFKEWKTIQGHAAQDATEALLRGQVYTHFGRHSYVDIFRVVRRKF